MPKSDVTARTAIAPGDGKSLALRGAFIRRTVLDGANLERAKLDRADMTGVSARRANFKNASLKKTILRGADLTDAQHLTEDQVSQAVLDEATKLPDYLDRSAIKQKQRARRGKLL